MIFQRNQPPIEQKRARAFVRVLECVSMNLIHSLRHIPVTEPEVVVIREIGEEGV
jgi:hypothetical protein